MNARQIEVNNYYKKLHPEALIIYHLPGQFVVLGDDVDRVRKSIPKIKVSESSVGVMPDDISFISTLSEDGMEIQLIAYRNEDGALDLPDVKRLQAEQDMDY